MDPKVAILIVDDRPDKILALEAVLEDLGQTIVRAYSGREALRHVLDQEFAVILLDVNMPGMDGFETASLIRHRQNSAHVPIIFITAFGDEMHAARGYSLGAVDYILAPVMPEVLRTKVGVFVDLFRKTEQLKRQAEWLRQRAAQSHKLADASLAINSAMSLEKMLSVVTDTAREITGAHQATATALLGHGHTRTSRAASFSARYPLAKECCGAMEKTDAYRSVLESNRPTRLSPEELERLARPEPAPDRALPPMRGWLAAPLTGRDGRNMGLIQLTDRDDGDFTSDDEAILVQLAQMASIAIENTLYSEEHEANRVKDEFLATLSHELRTPLNAILGWTQLLKLELGASRRSATALPPALPPAAPGATSPQAPSPESEVAHGLEVIERNARSQTKLIEDLLDVSRITTGKMRLNARPIALGPVVEAAADAVRPTVDSKRIAIDCGMAAAGATVVGDPDRLQQVFWNLLANAVKFTPEGGRVTVRLDYANWDGGDVGAGGWVRLTVADTGAGINPKFLPHVFDRFRQADSSSTRSHGGLGIGLTIVRHIVEAHGGSVSADSAGDGCGATFTVTLPLAPLGAPTDAPAIATPPPAAPTNPSSPPAPCNGEATRVEHAAPAPPADLSGLRVLVVDDESDTREVVAEILKRSGAKVVTAASVSEALAAFRLDRPDVLVSDVAMPDRDGYELIRELRALAPSAGGRTPAVALTAYARDEDRRRALESGFQAHLVKPVVPSALTSEIARLAEAVGAGNDA